MPAPLYLTLWHPYDNGRPVAGPVDIREFTTLDGAETYLGERLEEGREAGFIGCDRLLVHTDGRREYEAVDLWPAAREYVRQAERDRRDLMRQRPSWSSVYPGVLA